MKLLELFNFGVYGSKLPGPLRVVEEGPVVEPVVVRAVSLRVVGRGQDGHLVPVYGVAAKEVLHLGRD